MNPRYLEEAKELLLTVLTGRDAAVYLYGSAARGDADRASDIDIAVLPREPLPDAVVPAIRALLRESTIPYPADVVDLSKVDEEFRQAVLEEGICWRA
jgi:hypothetical protein